MAMKLYVGGLAYAVTEKELETLFAEHGTVTSAAVIKDRDSGQSKGFGFVESSHGSPQRQRHVWSLSDR
jgi:RNA recognition motif-containing protein